jgi:hypothetical protein
MQREVIDSLQQMSVNGSEIRAELAPRGPGAGGQRVVLYPRHRRRNLSTRPAYWTDWSDCEADDQGCPLAAM